MLSQDEVLHNSLMRVQLKLLCSGDTRNWLAAFSPSGYCPPLANRDPEQLTEQTNTLSNSTSQIVNLLDSR
jgi:hypothetical protein